MKRLTTRLDDHIEVKGCTTRYGTQERPGAYLHNAIVRLAEIEAILGDEYDLDQLRKLVR